MMQNWDNDTLLNEYSFLLDILDIRRRDLGKVEQEIMHRMREQGATSIPSETYQCELETRNTLDPSRLIPLKELLLPADLEAAWTPEHEETKTVPEKWSGVKLGALARRYGGEVKRIVDEAKVASDPTLRFRKRE